MQQAMPQDRIDATAGCRPQPPFWWEEAVHLAGVPGRPVPAETDRHRLAIAACRLAQEIAAVGFGVPVAEIRRASRAETRACAARHVAMYLANTIFGISLTRIGAAFGRERTSIAHALRRVEDWRDDEAANLMLERLEALAITACRAIDTGVAIKLASQVRR